MSMTRARDLLVYARQGKKPTGPWMDAVALPAFLPPTDVSFFTLANGHRVPFLRRHLTSGTATFIMAPPNGDLAWFATPTHFTAKLPVSLSPSQAAPVAATVIETVRIGTRIKIDRDVDPAALGEAVHACLAAYLPSNGVPLEANDIGGILTRMGVADAVSPDALLNQLDAIRRWLQERWPNAELLAEVPISQRLGNGQVMSGRIDLLLKHDDAWILIDYKSGSHNPSQWESLALRNGGQLAAYSAAIEAVTGTAVREAWLVLPVAGSALKVGTATGGLHCSIDRLASAVSTSALGAA
jgi:hypothetical protein